jgi:hypothetical protein
MTFSLTHADLTEKIVKIILITKNEEYLIKFWIKHHGDVFGYENLYIIDDSDSKEVLDYYHSISHLPIHFYFNQNNIETDNFINIQNQMNQIMNSVKEQCDFLIKLDTDEFIGIYDDLNNDILIDREMIRSTFNNLKINGGQYKTKYIWSQPCELKINPLDYIYFIDTGEANKNHKSFFYSKSFLSTDLGSHHGAVLEPYNSIINYTNIMIIHYHNQCFNSFIENSKKACITHNYIKKNDNKETQIDKLKKYVDSNQIVCSLHKLRYYYRYLTDPSYENEYYNSFKLKPNKLVFDKLCKSFTSFKNDKCIIITTINDPTNQVLYYSKIENWDLIIVGDSKTNNTLYKNINCIYLGLEEQKTLFPTLYDKIPLKSYTRKMFGYLYAIKHKYKVIYDTDDDNKYIENLDSFQNNFKTLNDIDFQSNDIKCENIWIYDEERINKSKSNLKEIITHFTFDKTNNNLFLKSIPEYKSNNEIFHASCKSGIFRKERVCSKKGFVNLYKIYTKENIWPRGIPPSHPSINELPELQDRQINMECVVIQGLVNNDPDVDAYYRININSDSFYFEQNQEFDVILDKYSVCPFNTQNTFWTDPTMFYAMYLPVSVTFRYTDILRGFVALYQLWKNNKTIKFTFPTAIQERNPHDLNKDLESEIPMYQTAELVIQLLNNNKDATLQQIYLILFEHGIVDEKELDTLQEWISLINEFKEPQLDINFYRNYYPDLKHLSNEQLIGHWHSHGKSEGRICRPL